MSKLSYYTYNEQTHELIMGLVEADDKLFNPHCTQPSFHMFAPFSRECVCGKHVDFDFTRAFNYELKSSEHIGIKSEPVKSAEIKSEPIKENPYKNIFDSKVENKKK